MPGEPAGSGRCGPMACRSCGHENRPGAKFCVRCRTALPRACLGCGTQAAPEDQFCAECGADLPATGAGASAPWGRPHPDPLPEGEGTRPRPITYTPSHLAERILAARAELAGERKQV